ncbi:hypothetical protein [Halomonas halocynthiae]|uniref:hypothetical protein n=1 Tax=Halomonas halocynthiae TaxID=176290 RepID=UPI000425357C|nr:hypothetical protein [Halomonas halocynthiae]
MPNPVRLVEDVCDTRTSHQSSSALSYKEALSLAHKKAALSNKGGVYSAQQAITA